MIDYLSEARNDQWICEKIFPNKKNGFFVESGVMDGKTNSSTYILEKIHDWNGITFEPDIFLYERAKNIRKNCLFAALGENNTTMKFVASNQEGYSGLRECLLETEEYHRKLKWNPQDQWRKDGIKKEYEVKVIKLTDVLDMYNAPKTIDYIAFDMEGAEHYVIKTFDFNKYKVLAFSIEGDRCNDLLISKGYIKTENPFNLKCPWESYFLHSSIV